MVIRTSCTNAPVVFRQEREGTVDKSRMGIAEDLMNNRSAYDPSSTGFTLDNSPFYLMAHADYKYHEDMDKVLHKHGVSKPVYRVMTVLRERQPASIGAIAEAALTKRSTVSRIIDRMIEQGLVTTEPHPDDNRITEVTLTPAGQQTLRKLTPIVGRQFARAMVGISDRDIAHIIRTLQKISSNLSKLPIE
jgi:DNA-binding MarR family transcriptional regulator